MMQKVMRLTCRRSASSMRSMPMRLLDSSRHIRSLVVLKVGTTSVGGELLEHMQLRQLHIPSDATWDEQTHARLLASAAFIYL